MNQVGDACIIFRSSQVQQAIQAQLPFGDSCPPEMWQVGSIHAHSYRMSSLRQIQRALQNFKSTKVDINALGHLLFTGILKTDTVFDTKVHVKFLILSQAEEIEPAFAPVPPGQSPGGQENNGAGNNDMQMEGNQNQDQFGDLPQDSPPQESMAF